MDIPGEVEHPGLLYPFPSLLRCYGKSARIIHRFPVILLSQKFVKNWKCLLFALPMQGKRFPPDFDPLLQRASNQVAAQHIA